MHASEMTRRRKMRATAGMAGRCVAAANMPASVAAATVAASAMLREDRRRRQKGGPEYSNG